MLFRIVPLLNASPMCGEATFIFLLTTCSSHNLHTFFTIILRSLVEYGAVDVSDPHHPASRQNPVTGIHTPHLKESPHPLRANHRKRHKPKGNMLGRSAATAARVAARSQPKGQKRTFIDYLTNYPDRVSSIASVPPERRPRSFSVSPPFRTGSYAESTYTTNGFDLLETVFCSCWSVVAYNEWVAWH